jgi:hypothetical protein
MLRVEPNGNSGRCGCIIHPPLPYIFVRFAPSLDHVGCIED